MKNRPRPTGTPLAAALAQTPAAPDSRFAVTDSVPCPGPRFGKANVYRNTLLEMHGNDSFLIKDATQVYVEAKKLGIVITTRKEGNEVRVWRIS